MTHILRQIVHVGKVIIEGFAAAAHHVGDHFDGDPVDRIVIQKLEIGIGDCFSGSVLLHPARLRS